MTGPRIGLALGGGIARGWAHIGALRRLGELGLQPDVVCGTSMGALVGGFYLAQKLDSLAGILTRFRVVQLLDFALADSGILGGKRQLRELETRLGNVRIEELPTPFAAVATELDTGHKVWISEGRLGPAIRHFFRGEREEPNMFATMASSFNILLDRVARSRLAGDPPDLVIAPRVGHIGLLDFHRAAEAIEEGAKGVDRMVPELVDIMGVFGLQSSDPKTREPARHG